MIVELCYQVHGVSFAIQTLLNYLRASEDLISVDRTSNGDNNYADSEQKELKEQRSDEYHRTIFIITHENSSSSSCSSSSGSSSSSSSGYCRGEGGQNLSLTVSRREASWCLPQVEYSDSIAMYLG